MNPNERGGRRYIVVVGGSAGAIQALQTMLRGLPADYQGTILIVLHTAASSPGLLDTILGKVTPLPCRYAEDGEPLESGRIYLAPPDRHLTVKDDLVRVTFGPKQNWHRPAIDPLFASAARVRGRRVCGVVLSGMLDDGTIGLMAIQEAGGVTIVQSPDDASFPDMPNNALAYVEADYTVPVAEIPEILARLGKEPAGTRPVSTPAGPPGQPGQEGMDMEPWLGERQEPRALTCPECGGALTEETKTGTLQYTCFLGHGYTSDSLWHDGFVRLEEALWLTLRTTEESVALGRRLIAHARQEGNPDRVEELRDGLDRLKGTAEKVRATLYAMGER